MRKLINTMQAFGKDEEGAALVEYAVILGIILAVTVTVMTTIGTSAATIFGKLRDMMVAAAG
jgi:Flp pilus assembly pilin Flp